MIKKIDCIYPVEPFTEWTILYWIREDVTPKTVDMIARRFNLPGYKVRRILEKHVKLGRVYKRVESFWNGMFYATRWWYW